MIAGIRSGVSVRCGHCYRLVFVGAERQVDEEGETYVDAAPVWNAMSIHVRSRMGCTAGRRTT